MGANVPGATHGSSGRELCPTGHLQGMQPHKSPRSQRSLFLPRVLQAFLARPPASLCGRECGEPGVSSTPSCPRATASHGGSGNTGTGTPGCCSLPEAAEGSSQGPRTQSESPARRPAAHAEQHLPLRKTEPLVGLGALLHSPSHRVPNPFSAKPPSKPAPARAAELGSGPCGWERHRTGHQELQQPQGTPQPLTLLPRAVPPPLTPLPRAVAAPSAAASLAVVLRYNSS